jgi:hypothetical protein
MIRAMAPPWRVMTMVSPRPLIEKMGKTSFGLRRLNFAHWRRFDRSDGLLKRSRYGRMVAVVRGGLGA